jgi:putative hemolysin
MAKEAIEPRAALAQMPPLIKGYLRLGGFIGDGAVVDYAFNTTDVSIVVKMQGMADKYTSRYAPGE